MQPDRRGEALRAETQVTIIEPSNGWRALDLRELWKYRELWWVFVRRDIMVRYQQTLLGPLWVVLKPLLSVVMFTAVFGYLAKIPSDGHPYPLFVLAALVPWSLFSGAVAASGTSLLGSAGLISKVYFPRLLVPMASIGSGLVDFAVSALLLLALLPCFGVPWTGFLLGVPVLVAVVLFLALGVGSLFSALIVGYRDLGGLIGFLLQIWMYATPVVYPASLAPEGWRWVLFLNPMAGLIEGFRSAFLGHPFDLPSLFLSVLLSVLALAVGTAYFAKVERRFADII